MGARKPEGVRRSARIQGSKANPIDLTAPTPSPKSRVTKSKAPPKTKQATKRDCATCGRILSTQSFPKHITDDCNHDVNTCKACVKAWIPAQLDSVTYDKLSCPECPSILQNADVQKHAAKAVYDRFDELERRGIAETVPGWRWCMNPDCRAGQVHEPLLEVAVNAGGKGTKAKGKKKKSAEDDICECKECGAKACVPCDHPYHEGETCAAYQKRAKKAKKQDDASLKTIEKHAKPCPSCQKNIEKNGGCDQVRCTQCHTSFCYLCLATYATINREGHAKGCMYAQPGRIDPHAAHIANGGGNNGGGVHVAMPQGNGGMFWRFQGFANFVGRPQN